LRLCLAILGRFWRALGWVGLDLRRGLTFLLRPPARLVGRIGQRLGQLARRYVGRPARVFWLASAGLLARFWRFLGRLGLAERKLLQLLIWRPLLFVSAPVRWLYRRLLRRPLSWLAGHSARLVWRLLMALLRPPARLVARFAHHVGMATQRRRLRLERQWRSRWLLQRARLRVVLQHRPAPRGVTVAPRLALSSRSALRRAPRLAMLVTINVALVSLSFFLVQPIQHPGAFHAYPLAAGQRPAEPTATATAAPIPTMTATPQPEPTEIRPTPWPTPNPLAKGGSVLFIERRNGNSDIYALSVGQARPLRLTAHPADERDPAWSPDGRRLAFATHRDGNWEIYTLELANGRLRRLTNDPAFDAGPSWSDDGQWLVFESYRENNLDLYLLRADGTGQPIRLTEHPAPDYSPAWSPGGRHIAFTSWRSGNQDIFVMPLDAASDGTAQNVTLSPAGQEDNPAFSPDGRTLAFDDSGSGFELLYSLPLADYRPAGPAEPLGQQGSHPTWSPGGASFIYVYQQAGRSYLMAGGADSWSVAPQAYGSDGQLASPAWSSVALPPTVAMAPAEATMANGQPLFVETVSQPDGDGPPSLLWPVPVNAPAALLSDEVDNSFVSLRERIIVEAGWDFLGQVDALFEPIELDPLPGLSDRSWNKAGRAFDFYYRYALADDPQVEVVREDIGHQTYWRVYLRTAQQDGSQGEPLRDRPWDFRARYGFEPQFYDQGGKLKDYLPAGYYLDFTTLAADYGWSWTPAAETWRTYFPAIRFWHYENRQELSWAEAMQALYPAEEILEVFDSP
jgi:TolB protein